MKVFKEYRKVALVSKYYFVDKCRDNSRGLRSIVKMLQN